MALASFLAGFAAGALLTVVVTLVAFTDVRAVRPVQRAISATTLLVAPTGLVRRSYLRISPHQLVDGDGKRWLCVRGLERRGVDFWTDPDAEPVRFAWTWVVPFGVHLALLRAGAGRPVTFGHKPDAETVRDGRTVRLDRQVKLCRWDRMGAIAETERKMRERWAEMADAA